MSADIEIQKGFYRSLCTPLEIERIFSPQNARDYLLRMRADYIVDHMRIFRFYRRLWMTMGERYSLEGTFRTNHYDTYLKMLGREDRESLSVITFGDIFTMEANGEIFNSPFGRIVTISKSLRYFLEFSHLAILNLPFEVPTNVRFAALVIALRVMFQHEAMDFDVDPRGTVPPRVLREIRRPISRQLQFIAGHEFAHHLLGHLSDERLHDSQTSQGSGEQLANFNLRIYSISEQEELNADLAALMRPQISDSKRTHLLNAALLWFGALELYQHAKDIISPTAPSRPRSHPSARDRHLHLVANVETKYGAAVREISESVTQTVESFKPPLSEFLSLHIDSFETYGSIYLDSPNTAWRGEKLIDRVDYY